MTRQMVEERIRILTVQSMLGNGRRTSKMVLGLNNGSMESVTKDNIETAQKQAKEFSSSLTLATTKASS